MGPNQRLKSWVENRQIKKSKKEKLTTKIEVDSMRKETSTRKTFKKRCNRNETKINCICFTRNCQKPLTMATHLGIPSPFSTYHRYSLKYSILLLLCVLYSKYCVEKDTQKIIIGIVEQHTYIFCTNGC